MEHRAYRFDFAVFARELQPSLAHAVASDDWSAIDAFIDANRAALVNPYSIEPLDEAWRDAAETLTPSIRGAIALTKYYDPVANIGLGSGWMSLFNALESVAAGAGSLTLGDPLEAGGRSFDPSLQGTFFQDPLRLRTNLVALDRLVRAHTSLVPIVPPLAEMLFAAVKTGLFVTF